MRYWSRFPKKFSIRWRLVEVGIVRPLDGAAGRTKRAGGDESGRGQQYLRAGLVDELSIHLVPVLFGGGTRLFERLGGEHIQLETARVIETSSAVHMWFRVANRA